MARKRTPERWRVTVVEVSNYDEGNRANRSRIQEPTWEQIRDAVLTLDAQKRSDMTLSAADGSVLAIGGGRGRYHVYASYTNTSPHESAALIDPSRGDENEILIVGRVETPLPARMIVDAEMTLRAAQRFFKDGSPEPSLDWETC